MLSLIIPIYKNEPNLERLLAELGKLNQRLGGPMEVVFRNIQFKELPK